MALTVVALSSALGVSGDPYVVVDEDDPTAVLGVYIIRDDIWVVGYVVPQHRRAGVTAAFLSYCEQHLGAWPPSTQFVSSESREYAEHIGLAFTETESPPSELLAAQTRVFESLGAALAGQAQADLIAAAASA